MKWLIFTLAVEAIFFLSALSFFSRPNLNNQLLFVLSLLVILLVWPVSLILSFFPHNKKYRRKFAAVLLLAPISLFLSIFMGIRISNYLFYRDLPRMKEVVALIQNGAIPLLNGNVTLPKQYNSLDYFTLAHRDASGALTVTFIVGVGFPVKHLGYLYRSDDVFTAGIRRDWPSSIRKERQWFIVSD